MAISLHWSEVLTLYRWELRSALRDRTIVINSVIVPLVLYPLILWGMFTGIAFIRGQTDDMASRLAVVPGERSASQLISVLREDPQLQLMGDEGDRTRAETRVREGRLDALLVLDGQPVGPAGSSGAIVVYDGSKERSDLARRRVVDALGRHRQTLLRQEALSRGVEPTRWTGFAIVQLNTASRREMGAFLLGLMLPLFFIVMVALGCLNPAIDSTAGERERGTWETLMTTSASRGSIVTAKYLTVTTLGGLAGLLNVLAMVLTMRGVVAPLAGAGEETLEFGLAPAAVPVLVVSAVLLAGLLSAGMMLLASFARTFREGQSLVMPLYLAAVLPVTFLSTPGARLTVRTALIPVINVALAAREAIGGTIRPLEMLVATLATLAVIALLLRLAAFVLAAEEIVAGSYSGSLFTFLRSRRARRGVDAAAR